MIYTYIITQKIKNARCIFITAHVVDSKIFSLMYFVLKIITILLYVIIILLPAHFDKLFQYVPPYMNVAKISSAV